MTIFPYKWTIASFGLVFISFMEVRVNADNVLVNPMIGKGSHFSLSAAIGEALVERGHNVTFLLSNAFEKQARDSRYGNMFHWEVFRHPIPVQTVHDMFANLSKMIFPSHSNVSEWSVQTELLSARLNDCRALLNDKDIIQRLHQVNFSAVLYDSTWICGAMVGEMLNIPYFAVYPYPSPCLGTLPQGSGFSPAYVPTMMTPFSNTMTFRERVINSLIYALLLIIGRSFYSPYKELSVRFGVTEPLDFMAMTKLWLVNSDFVGEFPCALPPNVIPAGGLTTREADGLPSDLEDFIQLSGNNGIIICSFGSFLILDDSNVHIIQMFSDAFGMLTQRVIWLMKGQPPFPVPSNTKILSWLPQNDILGHPKTKALFFHGGHNSYYEAIYHGVPMVVMPVFGDQVDVASRVAQFGLGLRLDKVSVNADNVYNALLEVTTNETYRAVAKRKSAAFRDQPMRPAQKAAFWIDHVIKHGTGHLEIPIDTLNFFQYYLLDVIVFIIVVVIIFVYILVKCCCVIRHRVIHKFSVKSKME